MTKRILIGCLISWGFIMSLLVLLLMADHDDVHDLLKQQAEMIEFRDEFYKKIVVMEAQKIDELDQQVQAQEEAIENLTAAEKLQHGNLSIPHGSNL